MGTSSGGWFAAQAIRTPSVSTTCLPRTTSGIPTAASAYITETSATFRAFATFARPSSRTRFYNLGAQSHVGISFQSGESTLDFNAIGPYRILDTLKRSTKPVRFYQASSSEMFGASPPPQSETTPFLPQSPYGVSKVSAFFITRLYRVAYGMFASNGILFNHESPRRGVNFVTRKITQGIVKIVTGETNRLYLGNLDAKRDWGFAGDYVEGIWRILQHESADDFVISTGQMHTVREFLAETFSLIGLDWEDFVEIEDRYKRPAEVPALLGDSSKARRLLGWNPRVTFKELCHMMLEADFRAKGLSLEEATSRAGNLRARVRAPRISQ